MLQPQRTLVCNIDMLDGYRMVILPPKYNDPVSTLLANNGIYETFITEEIVLKHIKEGQVVVDVGAQIGYYSVLFGKLVGSKGKVYAFEPDSRNFEILAKNLRVNKLKQVKPVKAALADFIGTRQLFTNPLNRGASSFISPCVSGVTESRVRVITLDKFLQQNLPDEEIDFIKIDVEGAELLVLKGAKRILKQSRLFMMLEFCPSIGKQEEESLQLLNSLWAFGFTINLIQPPEKAITLLSEDEAKKLIKKLYAKGEFVNLLVAKGEPSFSG